MRAETGQRVGMDGKCWGVLDRLNRENTENPLPQLHPAAIRPSR